MQIYAHIAAIKNSTYVAAFVLANQYMGYHPESMAILMTLMLVDTITGTIRSGVVNGGPSVTSTIGTKGLLSKILLLTSIFSFGFAMKGIGFELENIRSLMHSVVVVFILSEVYSVVGNVHSTLTRKPKAEYDALAWLLRLIRDTLIKVTGKPKDL